MPLEVKSDNNPTMISIARACPYCSKAIEVPSKPKIHGLEPRASMISIERRQELDRMLERVARERALREEPAHNPDGHLWLQATSMCWALFKCLPSGSGYFPEVLILACMAYALYQVYRHRFLIWDDMRRIGGPCMALLHQTSWRRITIHLLLWGVGISACVRVNIAHLHKSIPSLRILIHCSYLALLPCMISCAIPLWRIVRPKKKTMLGYVLACTSLPWECYAFVGSFIPYNVVDDRGWMDSCDKIWMNHVILGIIPTILFFIGSVCVYAHYKVRVRHRWVWVPEAQLERFRVPEAQLDVEPDFDHAFLDSGEKKR